MNKKSKITLIICIIVVLITAVAVTCLLIFGNKKPDSTSAPQGNSVQTSDGEIEENTNDITDTDTDTDNSPEAEKPDAETLYNEYKRVLFEQAEELSEDYATFCLYDVDEDGIPEVFISEGDFHVASVIMLGYNNGTLNVLNHLGTYGEGVYLYDDYIGSFLYMNGGAYGANFYTYSKGELNLLISFYSYFEDPMGEGDYIYEINDEQVSESEYNKMHDKYADAESIDLSMYMIFSLTRDNIEGVLNSRFKL